MSNKIIKKILIWNYDGTIIELRKWKMYFNIAMLLNILALNKVRDFVFNCNIVHSMGRPIVNFAELVFTF